MFIPFSDELFILVLDYSVEDNVLRMPIALMVTCGKDSIFGIAPNQPILRRRGL